MSERVANEVERVVLARIASNRLVLPASPQGATKALETLREPNFRASKLVQDLERDPILAVLVLRSASSAAHGRPVEMKSLDQAVSRLGAQQLKGIIVEYMAHELFQSSDRRINEANNRVWEHSVVVGLIARDVAALVGNAEPDSCYLAGLLHDIGKPVMGAMLLEVERSTSRNGSAFISSAQWTAIVDRTHRRVGVAVASEWKLADSITSAIRDCSDYDAADRASAANIVRFSNALAKREGFGTGTVDMSDVEALVMVGKSMLGADETIVNRLVANVRPRLQQAK